MFKKRKKRDKNKRTLKVFFTSQVLSSPISITASTHDTTQLVADRLTDNFPADFSLTWDVARMESGLTHITAYCHHRQNLCSSVTTLYGGCWD